MANKKSTKSTKKVTKTNKKKEIKKEKVEEKIVANEDTREPVREVKKSSGKRNMKGLLIAIIGIIVFFGISLILPTGGEKKTVIKNDVTKWSTDVREGTVVTVLASTTCSHCQEYKPVITRLAKENDFNLYFFELEELSQDEQNVVTTTFDLENFDGGVPFTFIVKNGKVVSDTIGFATEDDTVKFLKTNEIIK